MLTRDGEPGLAEGLSALINGQQRCHWHARHDLEYTLRKDGVSKQERRTWQEDLALVLGVEIPNEDLEPAGRPGGKSGCASPATSN